MYERICVRDLYIHRRSTSLIFVPEIQGTEILSDQLLFRQTASLTTDNAAKAFELLGDAYTTRLEALEAYLSEPIHENHDQVPESDSPIIDVFVKLDEHKALLEMTRI